MGRESIGRCLSEAKALLSLRKYLTEEGYEELTAKGLFPFLRMRGHGLRVQTGRIRDSLGKRQ